MTDETSIETPKVPVAPVKAPELEEAPVSSVVDDGVADTEPNAPVAGQWVDILDGEYAGRRGAYLQDSQADPRTILVQTRDADNLVVEVPYDSVRLSAYTGGR